MHTRNRNAQLQLVKPFENTNVWLLPGEEGTLDGVGSSSVAGLGTAGVHALGGSPMIRQRWEETADSASIVSHRTS